MEEFILDYLSDGEFRGFDELEEYLQDNGFNTVGEYSFIDHYYSNVFYWYHMSKEFQDCIVELNNSNKIELTTTLPIFYNKVPLRPIAKNNTNYKSLRWLPVFIRIKK